MTTPSEKIVKSSYDGKKVTDSEGRTLTLRKPRILDTYDLIKALGDDAKNQACFALAYNTLYVGMINNDLVQSPKTYGEVRALLQRLDDHGIEAIGKVLVEHDPVSSEKEAIDSAKK